ncbi:MAG: uroporphyrinogen-III C-methyltransferase [Planctomycetaceae bacterium]
MSVGRVYLVGAGPGDPGLLTLRGAELLARADLVLYDGLANPLLLRLTRGVCERTSRAREHAGATVPQSEVNQRLIAAARTGKCVVRLKGGDPFLFGRGSEEARALAEAGVPFEVVPGVTAAIAAGEYAGISLTHRELASAVAFITGHEDPTKPAAAIDYAALARFPGTLVFYMGLNRLPQIAAALIEAGLSTTTPAAVICKASRPEQRTVTAALSEIAAVAEQAELQPPSLIVVGECVSQRERIAWFEQRPLFGQRIGITRPDEITPVVGGRSDVGQQATIARCLELGADPVLMPLIDVRPVADYSAVDATLAQLDDYDWLIFTSANGVNALFNRLWEAGGDLRRLGGVKIACIGPATASALQVWRLRADLVPDSYRAEALAAALIPVVGAGRALWARASRGRDVLPNELRSAGATVDELVVYENNDVAVLAESVERQLAEGRLDWIGLSSPSIARHLAKLLTSGARDQLGQTARLAAISPVTAAAAGEAGLPVDVVAETFTWEGLFDAMVAAGGTSYTASHDV